MRTLYLCYFGLREPLVQTQVLPYLRQLSREGIEAGLLTFEPDRRSAWPRDEARDWRDRLRADGIRWFSLPYHKRPSLPATTYDITVGGWVASQLVRQHGYGFIHARAHVAAAMGALAKRLTGSRLIFDIRGFNPEEYVDAGVWPPGGLNYRLAKWTERRLLAAADGFVVLTERAREILFLGGTDVDRAGRPIEVIPCCVDLDRFGAAQVVSREEARRELGVNGRRVLVYVGALGGLYPTEDLAEFLAVAHQQDRTTFSVILTQSPPELLAEPLRRMGVPSGDWVIRRVPVEEIPRYLKAADLAISFKKDCYSQASCSPTKVAEYLASGLPVISSPGIGDTDSILKGDGVGVIIPAFNREGYRQSLQAADLLRREPGIVDRCRASAARRFDLERVGGERYRRLYHRLQGVPGCGLSGAKAGA
jgi:glycosyltransferase involved in cell wall biosynthesis